MKKLTIAVGALLAMTAMGEVRTAEIGFSGYMGQETLADFPALIKLPDAVEGFAAEEAGTLGENLWFTDAEGRVLAHEVDHWDGAGKSYVWVKVPTLTAATKINVHWGAVPPSEKPPAASVWTGYTGVWHMNRADSATGTVEPDASGNGLAATPSRNPVGDGRVEQILTAPFGQIGMCIHNQQSGSTRNALVVPAYWDKMTDASVMTLGGWFRMGRNNGWARFFSAKNSNGEGTGWEAYLGNGSMTQISACGSSPHRALVTVPDLMNNWVHLQFVFNGDVIDFYANGRLYGSLPTAAIQPRTDGTGFVIGATPNFNDDAWCGFYDEVRLYNGVLSADRIRAEYDTAHDPVGFVKGQSAAEQTVDLYTTGYTGAETLTDFPVQVVFPDNVPGFTYADAADDGSDIWFSDAEGNPLPFDCDGWKLTLEKDTGKSVFWVKLPRVTHTTKFTVHWGGTPPVGLPDSTRTWDGYVGVWHMGTARGEPLRNEPDATGHGLDAVPASAQADKLNQIFTRWTGALYLHGACTQIQSEGGFLNGLQVPNYSDHIADHSKFAVEGWFYTDRANGYSRLFSAQTSNQEGVGWEVWHAGSTTGLGMTGSRGNVTVNLANFANRWIHALVVYDGNTVKLYYNGQLVQSGNVTPVVGRNDTYGFTIGGNANLSDSSLFGCADEVRLYNGTVSAERAFANYLTQARSGDFISVEPPSGGDADEELPTYANRFSEATYPSLSGTGNATVLNGYGSEQLVWTAAQQSFRMPSPAGGALATSDWGPYGSLTLGPGDWTYHTRVKSANLTDGALWGLGNCAVGNTGLVLATDGTNGVALVAVTDLQPVEGARVALAVENPTGAYHDYGFVFQMATKQIACYVDGVLKGTLTHPAYDANNGSWAWLCPAGGTGVFARARGACLEDVRFYRRALSADELADVHRWLSRDPAVRRSYAATVTRDLPFSELAWSPAPPAEGFSADDFLEVTFAQPDKSLYMWDVPRVAQLTVRGCADVPADRAGRMVEMNSFPVWPRSVVLENAVAYDAFGHGNKTWIDSPFVTMGEETSLVNTGVPLGSARSEQANSLALKPQATAYVGADVEMGLIGEGYYPYWIDLNGGTLVKRGTANCWMANATVFGPGKLAVDEGKVSVFRTGFQVVDAEVEVRSGAELDVQVASEIDRLTGTGAVTVAPGSVLTVKKSLSGLVGIAGTDGAENAVVLADGATLDLSANTEPFIQPASMAYAGVVKVVPPGKKVFCGRLQLVSWEQPPLDPAVRFEAEGVDRPMWFRLAEDGLWIDMSGTMIYVR